MLTKFAALPALTMGVVLGLAIPAPAAAEFANVTSRTTFENLVNGRELRRFGISLVVTVDGQITGRAFGSDVEGAWSWQDGYFCRDLFFGGDDLGYNCQLVQVHGDTVRFTTDRGAGEYADLTLR